MKGRNMTKHLAPLALAVSLLLTSCGGGAKAATMHLRRSEGRVSVSDGEGKDLEPAENLGLYSGYGVDTRSESYAWIDLDQVKLTKLDQDSEIEIKKEDKHLEIQVLSGSLFFNVTEPLEGDETMDIRTSNMIVGIRGTCGWVVLSEDKDQLSVYLLEGKVRCEADGEKETVRAGEMAVMTEDGQITVEEFSAADVPSFVMEEIEDNDDLIEAILEDSAMDLTGGGDGDASGEYGDVPGEYAEALAEIDGEILYTEMVDFEADGNPELLVLHTRNNERTSELFAVSIYRAGPDGVDDLYLSTPQFSSRGTFSLVESGGRMYLETFRQTHNEVDYRAYHYSYDGPIGEKDGDRPSWSGDDRDWGMLYSISRSESANPYTGGMGYRILYNIYNRGREGICTAEEYEEIYGKFSRVKVLAYSPDGESLIIAPEPSEVEDILEPAVLGEPEEGTLPTDGDRTVLAGTVGRYTYNEVLALQGENDPNAGYSDPSQVFLLILLDTPQAVTARSGDGLSSYEREATMIDVTFAAGLEQYEGQHVVFSIDPRETWWPSDTSLPLGEPSTDNVHVLE